MSNKRTPEECDQTIGLFSEDGISSQCLIWGLEELADREFQERVWLGKPDAEMSSFEEACCHVFNDSGLADALDSDRKCAFLNPELLESAVILRRLL